MQKEMLKNGLTVALLYAALLLTACSGKMPSEANEALLAYWASLPSDPGLEYTVVRSWSGHSAENPDVEIWCVEAEMSAPGNPALDGEKLVWIVLRPKGESTWTAAMLATMSSTWPYEACGQGP